MHSIDFTQSYVFLSCFLFEPLFFQKCFVDQMALLEMTIYFRIHSILRVNLYPPCATHLHHWTGTSLDWILASRLFGTKPLSKPMMTSQSHPKEPCTFHHIYDAADDHISVLKIQPRLWWWTQWGWDKMAIIFKFSFLYENCCILILISLKYVTKCSVYNKPAKI